MLSRRAAHDAGSRSFSNCVAANTLILLQLRFLVVKVDKVCQAEDKEDAAIALCCVGF